jgi:hypothetical protein
MPLLGSPISPSKAVSSTRSASVCLGRQTPVPVACDERPANCVGQNSGRSVAAALALRTGGRFDQYRSPLHRELEYVCGFFLQGNCALFQGRRRALELNKHTPRRGGRGESTRLRVRTRVHTRSASAPC